MNLSKAARILGIKQLTTLCFPMSPLPSPRRQPQAHSRSYSEEKAPWKTYRNSAENCIWQAPRTCFQHLDASTLGFPILFHVILLIGCVANLCRCDKESQRANACLKYRKRNFLMGIHRYSQKQCHQFPQGIKMCSFSRHIHLVKFSDWQTSWQGG